MSDYTLVLPEMGEGIMEATIIKWLKLEGDLIREEEEIIEVATDKVDSEIPSPCNGKIKKWLVKEGDVVKIGSAIAIIERGDSFDSFVLEKEHNTEEPALSKILLADIQPIEYNSNNVNSDIIFSPLVKSIISKEKIPHKELHLIQPTGLGGRITKDDIFYYLKNRKQIEETELDLLKKSDRELALLSTNFDLPLKISDSDEIIEIDRMRNLISKHMTQSKNTAVHVTSFVEADMTNIVKWREKNKEAYKTRENENLSFTPIILNAVIKALKDFPMLNISFDGKNIIKKKAINIGIATALPNGNLIVPVIKNADELSLLALSKKNNQLIFRARNNKLQPTDITEGTYTVSNIGTFGNLIGTPIINQPQVAILAVGAIKKKASVIETPDGDFIGIRQKMFLSHSYDHRIIDGMLGGSFVLRVAQYLEAFDKNTII